MGFVRKPTRSHGKRRLVERIDPRVVRELHARGYAKPGDDRTFREEIRAMFDSGPLGAVNPPPRKPVQVLSRLNRYRRDRLPDLVNPS